ncbi:hypothetical protein [Paenibacillus sp. y28]|uniref:hypothetical protein n=1 Tax=Paenibacillus sp. y28 TaxID=3129110 RepID=UPI0030186B2D
MVSPTFKNVIYELDRRQYKKALSLFKKVVGIKNSHTTLSRIEMLDEIKRTRILINLSKDKDRDRCFCSKAINYLKQCSFNHNYFDQCETINKYLKIYNKKLQETILYLNKFIYPVALLRLSSSFENLNQILLMQDGDDISEEMKNLFPPISYENNIEILNLLLKECIENNKKNKFGKEFSREDVFEAPPLSIDRDVLEDVNKLAFLKWLIEEITIHDMEIRKHKDHVEFVYLKADKYIQYKLPFIREGVLNKHIDAEFFYDRINQQIDTEYDISELTVLSNNNRNFTFEMTNSILGKVLFKSAEIGEREEKKISNINMIPDLSHLKHNDIDIKHVFMFYFCLRGLAEVYFNGERQIAPT